MLTEHQKIHLNAVLLESKELLNGDLIKREKHAKSKGIKKGKEAEYFSAIIEDVENILSSKNFPDLEKSYMIHDYLEKNRGSEFNG